MVQSLKERHDSKRLEALRNRIAVVDVAMLSEQRAAKILVEAIDNDDLERVGAIIKKLSTVKVPQLPKLKAAIERAEAEINRYTAGGPLTKAWTKMKDLVGIDNPVVKVTAFADALERGFSQIPQIMKNNGVDLKDVDLDKSLVQVLGRLPEPGKKKTPSKPTGYKSDKEFSQTSFADNTASDYQEGVQLEAQNDQQRITSQIKNIVAQLQKAMAPSGVFGAFKQVPYINSAELAQELMHTPLRVFSQVAKKINSGAKAADVAPDMKSQASGGDIETRATNKEEPTKHTSQTATSAPTKQTTTTTTATPVGEKPSEPRAGGASQNYAKARQRLRSLIDELQGEKNVYDLLAKRLVDAGLDPDKI